MMTRRKGCNGFSDEKWLNVAALNETLVGKWSVPLLCVRADAKRGRGFWPNAGCRLFNFTLSYQ
jgi:hypothetical protein